MIKVYTKSRCPQCSATIRWLDKHSLTYEVESVEGNEEVLKQLGFIQAPVVIVGDSDDQQQSWSGYRPDKLVYLTKTKETVC